MPEGVERIEKNAFSMIKTLKKITLPTSLKFIGESAIGGTSVESITLPENLEEISDKAFMANNNLTAINFPNSLKKIGKDVFLGDKDLNGELTLGENLEKLGRNLFGKGSNSVKLKIAPIGKKIFISEFTFGNEQNSLDIPQGREIVIKARAFTTNNNINLNFGEISIPVGTSKEEIISKLNEKVLLKSAVSEVDFKSIKEEQGEIYEIPIKWSLDDVDTSKEGEVSIESSFSEVPQDVMSRLNPSGNCNNNCPDDILSRTKVVGKINFTNSKTNSNWTQDDFTYEIKNDKISKYKDSPTITGLSEQGKKKIETNKDLVIPDFIKIDGQDKRVLGIGEKAFEKLGLKSVKLPEVYPKDGNFIIRTRAFADNDISELKLPEAIYIIDSFAFKNNKIKNLDIPSNLWKVGNEGFAHNEIEELNISDEVHLIQLDSYSFSYNKIKSVDYPFSAFKTLGLVFMRNPGMEPINKKGEEGYGKVYLYTRNPDHLNSSTYIKNSIYQEFKLKSEVIRDELYETIKKAAVIDISQYTEKSTAKLNKELESARQIMSSYDVDQNTVDEAVKQLNKAIDGLELIGADKSKLAELVKDADEFIKEKYTAESFSELSKWLDNAKKILKNNEASEEEVNNAVENLSNAIKNLKVKPDMMYNLDDFVIEGDEIKGFSDKGKEKFKYNKDLVLPSFNKEGKAIKKISDKAFAVPDEDVITSTDDVSSPKGLKTVVFPKELEEIGNLAFRYNAFEHIDLPKTLKKIGDSAFNGNQLKGELVIPDSVEEIGKGAFSLNLMTKVVYPKSMTYIPDGAFSRDIYLKEFTFNEGLKTIGQSAFQGAPFKNIKLPSTLERIGKRAFSGHRMEKITIPGNVKVIEFGAFEHNKKFRYLRELVLEEGIEEIGKNAFADAILEKVNLPNSLKKLDKDAFKNNTDEFKNPRPVKLYTKNPKHKEFLKSEYQEIILSKPSSGGLSSGSSTYEPSKENRKIDRVDGYDRVATSVEISKKYFKKADNVIIVDGENFSDALSSGGLAGILKSPILAVDKRGLRDITKSEIKRLGAKNAIIVGGKTSVDEKAEKGLEEIAKVDRISGKDRYETSKLIAKKVLDLTGNQNMIVVDGENFPDALSSSGLSSAYNASILLVKDGNENIDFLKNLTGKKIIIGGENSVSSKIENKVGADLRIYGRDRYQTSLEVAKEVFKKSNNKDEVFVSSGKIHADALSIAPVVNMKHSSLILMDSENKAIKNHLDELKVEDVHIIGGDAAVKEDVVNYLR